MHECEADFYRNIPSDENCLIIEGDDLETFFNSLRNNKKSSTQCIKVRKTSEA